MFVAELVAARTAGGLTQAALSAKINYSESLISMIERYLRTPTPDLAERLDNVFGTTGTFVRLQGFAKTSPIPAWFKMYAEFEATATHLRSWHPLIIDGLFQTEDYARALLSMRPNTSPEEVEALVSARMERQAVLSREKPPLVWLVLDEAVLQREIGGPDVMRVQLQHLAEMSLLPNITVEVVPHTTGAHSGLLAPFAIAEASDGSKVGYLDTATEGYIVEDRSVVADLMLIFDTLRGEALPRRGSHELIMKWAGGYDGPE